MHTNPSDRDRTSTLEHARLAAAEVKEFITKMKGKNPQEVLGLVSESGLVMATVWATLGTILLVVVWTAGDLAWARVFPKSAQVASTQPAPQAKTTPTTGSPTPPPSSTGAAPPSALAAKLESGGAKPGSQKTAADTLGVNETKTADPKVNPLDKSVDDLFKEIEKK